MSTEDRLVSIVIPAYNSRATIERCVHSVLQQSWTRLEIVCVDDGSTDDTGTLLDRMARRDDRLRVIHQPNMGSGAARDRGVEVCRGEYLTFVDSDDWIAPDYIRNFVITAASAGADVCLGTLVEVLPSGTGHNRGGHEKRSKLTPRTYLRNEDETAAYRLMSSCGRFYRMTFWKSREVRFDTARDVRGEDIPVALYTNYFAGRIAVSSQAEYYYYQHEDSGRHQMRSLRKVTLPYHQIEAVTKAVWEDYAAETRSADHWFFYEFGLIKTLAQMVFDIGRGADSKAREQMYAWQADLLGRYCTDLDKNPYLAPFNRLHIPQWLKLIISLYLVFYRMVIIRYRH